jgi:hypothetical protein
MMVYKASDVKQQNLNKKTSYSPITQGVYIMKIGRMLLAALAIWIFSTIWMFLTCGWLFSWIYEIEPIIWYSAETMMSAQTLIFSNLFGILSAVIFVLVFAVLYKGIPKKGISKGLVYGFLVWLIGPFSGMISMPLYMTIAPAVIVYWLISALITFLVMGVIAGAIYKPR